MDKAKQRERDQEIVYERKLAKERTKDDHLFADKDKFVTSAYKRKLAEQAKWLEEEKLRDLREEKDDVTKKSDITDFYFSLSNNVAFGARDVATKVAEPKQEKETPAAADGSEVGPSSSDSSIKAARSPSREEEKISDEALPSVPPKPEDPIPRQPEKQPASEQPKSDHHKRSQDALAVAKERFLARKKKSEGFKGKLAFKHLNASYSHLISSSSPPPSLSPPDSPPLQDKEKIESEEFEDYMKSDSYLYSPLDLVFVTQPPSPPPPPPKHSGNQVQLKKVSKEILFTRISAHKTKGTPKVVAAATNGYNLRRP